MGGVRRAGGTAAVCLLVVFVGGCGGSSSKPPPRGGPADGGWEVFGQGRHNKVATIAGADGIASDPARLRLQINATPNVSTRARYQVQCGQGVTSGTHSGKTPFTQELAVPSAGGSQESHGLFCNVSVRATKPASAEMIVTLLEQPAPSP
jgi:hypothetical protein